MHAGLPCLSSYAAPEQIANLTALQKGHAASQRGLLPLPGEKAVGYDASCDLWSLGVILYTMLCGYPPFFSRRKDVSSSEILQSFREGSITFPAEQWKCVSMDAKKLVASLLKFNAADRPKADDVLNHAWLKDHTPPGRLDRRNSELLTPGFLQDPPFFKNNRKRSRSHLAEVYDQYQLTIREVLLPSNPVLWGCFYPCHPCHLPVHVQKCYACACAILAASFPSIHTLSVLSRVGI